MKESMSSYMLTKTAHKARVLNKMKKDQKDYDAKADAEKLAMPLKKVGQYWIFKGICWRTKRNHSWWRSHVAVFCFSQNGS